MKATIAIGLGVLFSLTSSAAEAPQLPKVRVVAQVVDEAGSPVTDAHVKLIFGEARNANAVVKVENLTDGQGKVVGEGYSDGSFGAVVSKPGYYLSGLSVPPLSDIVNRKSQQVEARSILRPIQNPVAMYAKTGWFDLPVADQPCGFDLEAGDWIAPYGSGAVADLVFTLARHYESRDNFEVTVQLRFTNARDGIQETKFPDVGRNSVFKWQREAPENGYQPTLTSRFARKPGGGYEQTATENQLYLLRVRTIERDGRIVSALYGKISGGFQLTPFDSKTCKVKLTYYLNPTLLDRNLEWDTKRNLLSGLSFEQTPRDP